MRIKPLTMFWHLGINEQLEKRLKFKKRKGDKEMIKGFFMGLARIFDTDIKKEVYLPVQQVKTISTTEKKSYPSKSLKKLKKKVMFVAQKPKHNRRKVISR